MRPLSKTTLSIIALTLASSTAIAQQQPAATETPRPGTSDDPVVAEDRGGVDSEPDGDDSPINAQPGSNLPSSPSATGRSPVERMAMSNPEELEGKSITSRDGTGLGEIERVVRKTSDDELYAVVKSGANGDEVAVKLSELELDQIRYGSDELNRADFDETDFEPVSAAR